MPQTPYRVICASWQAELMFSLCYVYDPFRHLFTVFDSIYINNSSITDNHK